MGDKPVDGRQSEPSLELPSLFRRRNKDRGARARRAGEPLPVPDAEPAAGPDDLSDDTDREPPGEAWPAPAPWSEPEPEPVRDGAAEPALTRTDDRVPVDDAEIEHVPAVEGLETPRTGRRSSGARRAERRERRARSRPVMPPGVAAVVTGVLVGLFGALLTYGSLLGCDAVRGTKSCGGPGLLLLLVIVVLMVIVGALLLKMFKVSEPRGTSFLAVGLTAVVVLVTLMEELFSTWMFVAVPLISAAAFLVAQWVTTRYVELPERGPEHDIR